MSGEMIASPPAGGGGGEAAAAPAVRVLAGGAATLPRGVSVEVATPAGSIVVTTPRRLNGRWEAARPGGAPVMFQRSDAAQRARAADALGLSGPELFDVVAQAEGALRAPGDETSPTTFTMSGWAEDRPKRIIAEGPDVLATFKAGLEVAAREGMAFTDWPGTDRLCALDLDIFDKRGPGAERFTEENARRALRATAADVAWVTRSGGLRLVFSEMRADDGHLLLTALDRALAGLLLGDPSGPPVEKAELLSRTRPPAYTPSAFGITYASECGPLDATAQMVNRRRRRTADGLNDPPEALIVEWLAEAGMERGGRYSHAFCPIAPGETRSVRDPVAVLEEGVRCYRCEGTGDPSHGWRPWDSLVYRDGAPGPAREPNPLVVAARAAVHLAHARLTTLSDWFLPLARGDGRRPPEAGDAMAWRAILRAVHVDRLADPDRRDEAEGRLAAALDPSIAWVRGEGGVWLRDATLKPMTTLSRAGLRRMPWVRGDDARIDVALDPGPLEGFTPVRVFRGAVLRPDVVPAGVVPVVAPRPGCSTIRVLDPDGVLPVMPWADALAIVSADYPGLDGDYLMALLAAAACVEPGGPPPMLFVAGPTGAAKTTTINLAAALLGGETSSVPRKADEEDWKRQIGQGLAAGARFLLADEQASATWEQGERLRLLGEGAGRHSFRPLHGALTSVPWRAVIVATGRYAPTEWMEQPELGRRMRYLRLPRRVPREWPKANPRLDEWRDYIEPGLEVAPDQAPDRAAAGDALVSHAVALARRCGWDWDAVADALGLLPINRAAPEEAAAREGTYRALYAHLRGEDGQREASTSTRWPASSGWFNLGSRAAQAIVEPMLDRSDTARWKLTQDLNGLDWEAVLGLPGSRVRVEVRERGGDWVARALAGGGRQGAEVRGEACPPAPRQDPDPAPS
ncbi:MAG: hypothetical protein KF878_10250 [Planctomycetes bacterium]|nr:hypothetical protein [Planctomycetota bacterium]